MSDHDFEKRVKQKMDELRFTPSDAVWKGVQEQIRADRPRKRSWARIPVLMIIVGVTGYFLYTSNQTTKSTLTAAAGDSIEKQDGGTANKSVDKNASIQTKTSEGTETSEGTITSQGTKTSEGTTANVETKANLESNANAETNSTADTKASIETNASKSKASVETTASTKSNHLSPTKADEAIAVRTESTERGTEAGVPGHWDNRHKPVQQSPGEAVGKKFQKSSARKDNNLSPELTNNHNARHQKSAIQDPNVSNKTGRQPITGNLVSDKPIDGKDFPVKPPGDNKKLLTDTASAFEPDKSRLASDYKAENANNRDIDSISGDLADQPVKADSSLATQTAIKQLNNPDSSGESSKTLVKSARKKFRWEYGATIAGGVSNLNDGTIFEALKSSQTADAAASAPANNFLFAPVAAGVPPAKASTVKAGPYFSVGAFASKKISETFTLMLGLNYSQYNTVISVGYRVDSSRLVNNGAQVMNVSRYYRADQKSKFTNTYHFIEIPISLQTRLLKSRKMPVFWDAGFSFQQLIGSNALVFDSGTGVYYKDKSIYHDTQLGLSTGLSFGLLGRTKTPLLIGPSIKYHVSGMFDKDIQAQKHLFSAALQIRMLLRKN